MCKLVPLFEESSQMIASIKRDAILNLIEQAKSCPEIEKIVLFGSSLTEECTDESDIDIGVIGGLSETVFCRLKSYSDFKSRVSSFDMCQEYDMLYYKGIDSFSIDFVGTVIYSREDLL